jgi:hypothetical protein
MPFKSQAQRRYMYANLPKIAERWSKHTPKKKNLPEYVDESIDKLSTKNVGTNLEFKSVIPNMDKTEASVFYKVKSESGTDLVLVFSLGESSDDTDYQYGAIIDRQDLRGRPKKFEDPSSKETAEMLKIYRLTSEDIEMAGQDAYEQISQHAAVVPTLKDPYEESLEFETMVTKILNEKES